MTSDQQPATVVLFDIDGTMIDSSGAGGSALLDAVQAEFNVAAPVAVPLHGRTDSGIFRELLETNGVQGSDENYDRLCVRYFRTLPCVLASRPALPLAGVVELLEQMREHRAIELGLLTGNLPTSAEMKLKHFSLDHYFRRESLRGTFGDAARARPELKDSALRLAQSLANSDSLPPERIVLIGDTPLDIELAKVMQARCLAVATGGFSIAELTAAGATRAVDDLTDGADILQWCLQ